MCICCICSYLLDVASVDVSEVSPVKHTQNWHRCPFISQVHLIPVSVSGDPSLWLDKPEIWESSLTAPFGPSLLPLHPHGLPVWPLEYLWNLFSSLRLHHNRPSRGYCHFHLEWCRGLLVAFVLVFLQSIVHYAVSSLWTPKFKTLQRLCKKWRLR